MHLNSGKIIVTGGAGFIGSSLVKRLSKIGAKVEVIDNLWRGRIDNLMSSDGSYVIDINNKFHLADLTDYSKCLELIRSCDVVYHLADVVGGVHFALGNEPFIFRQNILINTNVLAACLENDIPNYIYVGTACSFSKYLQMNQGINVLTEDQTYPAKPESSYGWSKLMGEYEAELAKETGKINVGLLRLHNVYGPGSPYDSKTSQVIPGLIRKAVQYPKEPFIVWGSGDQYRDFVYIDDIIEALLLVYQKGMNKGLIQIGSEKATSIKELAKLIAEVAGKQIDIHFDTSKPVGDYGRIAQCDRARHILEWQPKVELKQGITRTYQWILDQMKRGRNIFDKVKYPIDNFNAKNSHSNDIIS
jgi:nucleoside-diphosphate-sugar epimerase